MTQNFLVLIGIAKDAALDADSKRQDAAATYARRAQSISDDYKPEVSAKKLAELMQERDAATGEAVASAKQIIDESFAAIAEQLASAASEALPDGFMDTVHAISETDLTQAEKTVLLQRYRNNFLAYRYISTHYGSTDAAAYHPDMPRYSYDDVIERLGQLKAAFYRVADGKDRVTDALMQRDGYTKSVSEVFTAFTDHNFAEAGRLLKSRNVNGR